MESKLFDKIIRVIAFGIGIDVAIFLVFNNIGWFFAIK